MENEGLLEKQNLFKRVFHLFEFNPSRAYDNFIIAIVGFTITLFLAKYLGYINVEFSMINGLDIDKHFDYWLGYGFLVVECIIVLFMIRKIPLEEMKREIPIFIFLIVVATFTAYLGSINVFLLVLVDIFWAILVCLTQLQNKNIGLIGLYSAMIYVYLIAAASTFYETSWMWLGETCLFIVACVIITAIPMVIIRLIKHNPYKREKLANCFRSDLKFHEFNVLKDELLSIDRSDRMVSLLSLANGFFIVNSNINTFSKYLEGNKDFKLFIEELDRLMAKLRKSILKGPDREFEVNIGYITEFQKNLEFELDKIPNKNPDQLLLDASIRKYKSLFEDLNQVLEDNKVINNISFPEKKSILNAFKNMNLSDSNIRFSFALVISVFEAFFLDEFFIHSIIYTTSLITAFTINSSLDNTQKEIIIRSIFTFVGVVLGICIIFLFEFLGIYAFLGILAIVAFVLFFVFKDDPQLSLIFLMLGFIFLIPEQSIMMSFEHLLATICSFIIILVVTTLLTPNQKETNIITLFKHKSNLIKKYNLLRFTKNNNIHLVANELSEVNFDILNLLDRFKDTFRDIDEDIVIFTELNSTFDDYVDTLTNIQKSMDDKKITYDLSSFINKTSSLFDWYVDIFEGKTTEFPILDEDITEFLEEISSKESPINFIYPLFNNLIIDLSHIYELLIQIKEKELYDVYDTKLIDHDLKNNLTLDNLRYIINHFRYVFVAYRYFNKFAKDSANTVVEEFNSLNEDSLYNFYNSSKEYAGKVSKQGRRGFDKIYTSSGEIIELSNEELKSIYELSKDNWNCTVKFVKILYGMTLKPFIHGRFKIRFYKNNEK
ncbi:MAG: hypothetical protein MJ203_04025 [archaeon]|nr:hypothetical protein [archaeon]